jgi:nucleolar protein 58
LTACALFHCDVDDEKNLGLLRDAGLNIRDISGIACEDWDILRLAIAVKVICYPEEELAGFHEVNNTYYFVCGLGCSVFISLKLLYII